MANSVGFQNRETVSEYCPLNFWPMSLSIFLLSLLQLSCLGYWEARYKRQLAHYWCISSVQFATPWTAARQASLSITQAHVYWVGDTIQPSHPQLSPSPPAFNLSQHQGLFQWVGSWHQVAKVLGSSASASVLPKNIQDLFPLELTGLISLQSKGLSRVFSSTTVQKQQFFGTQPSLWSKSHICTWLLEKPQLCLDGPLSAKWCLFILIHKSIRGTENCNACRQQRSTERAQFFSLRTPDCALHNHHFKSWTI